MEGVIQRLTHVSTKGETCGWIQATNDNLEELITQLSNQMHFQSVLPSSCYPKARRLSVFSFPLHHLQHREENLLLLAATVSQESKEITSRLDQGFE